MSKICLLYSPGEESRIRQAHGLVTGQKEASEPHTGMYCNIVSSLTASRLTSKGDVLGPSK